MDAIENTYASNLRAWNDRDPAPQQKIALDGPTEADELEMEFRKNNDTGQIFGLGSAGDGALGLRDRWNDSKLAHQP